MLRLGDGRVGVLDCDVNHPVRRNALRALVGTQRASGGRFAALEFEFGVVVVRTHRIVMGFPAEERAVEALGGVLVGGVEFNPAERAGGMLVDVCHSGGILHQIGPATLKNMKESFNAEMAEESRRSHSL